MFLKSEQAIFGAHVFAPQKLRREPCGVESLKSQNLELCFEILYVQN